MLRSRERSWSINGDFLTLAQTGVTRYASEVTRELGLLVSEGHPLTEDLALNIIAPHAPASIETGLPVTVVPEFRSPRMPQFWVQAQLPRHLRGGLLSFCNLAPITVRKHIVCIHDLHTFVKPESYGASFRLAHRVILPLLGKFAARITTVSEFSKQQLVQYGIAPPDKIHVTYNGADHATRWRPERSMSQWPERAFVLALGRSQAYKNTELFWKIAPQLDTLGIDLLVAGDFVLDPVVARALPSNVRLLGRIDDDELAEGLRRAVAFLFPSRIEGFGLPAAEAMTFGCPIVSSTSPCLPEICADAALYADPDDVEGWVAAIKRIHDDPELRAQLSARALERAQSFTWRKAAETYLKLMWAIDGRPEIPDLPPLSAGKTSSGLGVAK